MRWMLVVAAVIVGLIVVVVLVGMMLPKAHRATRMARFRQSPQAVFAAITGPQEWRNVTKIDLPAEGGMKMWREQSGRDSITFEEVTSDPPHLYRSRIADRNLPFAGTWTREINSTDDGCTCRITEEGEVFNPVFRFVSRFILGHTRTIEVYLHALGKKFNESVKTEA